MVELILKKKNGFSLGREEINYIIKGFTEGYIPDYQMSSLLMAICCKGLNDDETAWLTEAMIHSGEVIDLSSIAGIKVDKHSTGGVGDKTTLVLGPLVAAAGVPVAKMSGRGLGHTGGTLDKLESIPGLNVDLTAQQFLQQVQNIGLAVCAQNEKLVPADKKLYALRDVTGTVENISLIASSIMSKKLASGADAIVIDIKIGDGAFMKTMEEAEHLADIMKKTARKMGKNLVAIITGMDQPLGFEIGNLLEVEEAIHTLQGKGPEDLTEVCLTLGSHMLVLGGKCKDISTANKILSTLLHNGKAYEKFKEFIIAQGGKPDFLEANNFPRSPVQHAFKAEKHGYVGELNALDIGMASVSLGAGRETKSSKIDPLAGITLVKKQGDKVVLGDTLAILHTRETSLLDKALAHMHKAYQISDIKSVEKPLILKTVY